MKRFLRGKRRGGADGRAETGQMSPMLSASELPPLEEINAQFEKLLVRNFRAPGQRLRAGAASPSR